MIYICSKPSVAAITKMTPFAVLAKDWLSVIKATTTPAVAARTASRMMSFPAGFKGCCTAAATTAATGRAK